MNVLWQRRLVDRNASLGVNERRWMLLCRVIHLLGAQLLWAMSLVSGALLDYAWVISGQENLWCLLQRCYWSLQVRGSFWLGRACLAALHSVGCLAALHSGGFALGWGPVARGGFRGQGWFFAENCPGLRLALDVLDTRLTGDCHSVENRGWYSCSWEVSRLGGLELLGDEGVFNEG